MIDTQKIKQKAQIKDFKKEFYKEHNIKLFVLTPAISESKLSLSMYKKLTLLAIVEKYPRYANFTFKTKIRERDFILYIQAMSFLANKDGYSKTSIGKAIYRNHATVINSCKTISNGIDTEDKKICDILQNLQTKIDTYVGTATKNIKRKDDTKPVSDTIWDEARRFINS
tara:strand:+ start:348 stop:857 length:510 start_codon:yes stop_codon:yes gene_type:complete